MVYFHWLFLIVYGLIVIATMIAVLMDNRQPAKTMAWLLVLAFLPAVGIVLYFFFGQNIRKEKLISEKSLDQLSKRSMLEFVSQANLHLPENHLALMTLFAKQNGALPFKNNEVEIYTSGYEFFPALLSAIHHAKEHIHLDTFIFDDDPLGMLISDALIDKAREGVEIKVIYDDVGCWSVKNRFFERMREEGIEVYPFLPVRFPKLTSKVNYRNHRKLCVIDGKIGFIGGMNIALRYVKGTKTQAWRDTHIRIEGGAVYGLQKAFLVDWFFVDQTLITSRKYYPALSEDIHNNCIAQIVTSNPISPYPDIMHGYVRIINEAKRYIYMETPYFLPTEPVLFALRTAVWAGIDVRLMVPEHLDTKFIEWASRSYVMDAVESGVKIYFYRAGFNHSKFMVCDDYITTCGSTNIDFRSLENNFESNAFFYDEGIALRFKSMFLRDMKQCYLLNDVKERISLPFLPRLWESLIRLLSPLM